MGGGGGAPGRCWIFVVHFKFLLCMANFNKIEILFIKKFGSNFVKDVWNYENFMIF
jgi:hypothetical protein